MEGFPGKFDRYFRNERRELVCQEVMEVVQEQAEVQEWVDLGEEEWVVPRQAQVLEENACVQSAERRLPMKSAFPVLTRVAPSAEQRW